MKFAVLYESTQEDAVNKVVKTTGLDRETVAQLAAIDPTKKKSYLLWLALQLKRKNIAWPEDAETIRELIDKFEDKKKKGLIAGFDLNAHSIHDVREFISSFARSVSEDEIAHAIDLGAKKVAGDETYQVYKLSTPQQVAAASQNVAWCTKSLETAENYCTNDTPMYVVTKDGKRLTLIHPARGLAKDVNDRTLTRAEGSHLDKFIPAMHIDAIHGELKNLRPPISPEEAKNMTEEDVLKKADPDIAAFWLSLRKGAGTPPAVLKLSLTGKTNFEKMNTVADLIRVHALSPDQVNPSLLGIADQIPLAQIALQLSERTRRRFPKLEHSLEKNLLGNAFLVRYIANIVRGKIDNIEDMKKKYINDNLYPNDLADYIEISKEEMPWMKEVILTNPEASVHYSRIHKERLQPEAEEKIAGRPNLALRYANIHNARIEAIEKHIMDEIGKKKSRFWTPEDVVQYASSAKKTPWPEVEDLIVEILFGRGGQTSVEKYVDLISRHEGKEGLLRFLGKAKAHLDSHPKKKAGSLYKRVENEVKKHSDTGIAHKAGSGTGHAVYVARDAEGAKHFAGKAAAELAKKLDVSRENPVVLYVEKKNLLGASSATNILGADGDKPSDANASAMATLATRHLLNHAKREYRDLANVFGEKLLSVSNNPDTATQEEVVRLGDPETARHWINNAKQRIPVDILALAVKGIVPSAAVGLIQQALSSGVEPDEIPVSILNRATNSTNPIFKASELAHATHRRWRNAEGSNILESPPNQLRIYLSAIKGSRDKFPDDVSDLVDAMMNPDNPGRLDQYELWIKTAIRAVKELGLEEPAHLRKYAMNDPMAALAYARDIAKKRLTPEEEKVFLHEPQAASAYAKEFLKNEKRSDIEKSIADSRDGQAKADYAVHVLRHPWHEAENDIARELVRPLHPLARSLNWEAYPPKSYMEMVIKQEGDDGYKRLRSIINKQDFAYKEIDSALRFLDNAYANYKKEG